jgi:hypothetical protein
MSATAVASHHPHGRPSHSISTAAPRQPHTTSDPSNPLPIHHNYTTNPPSRHLACTTSSSRCHSRLAVAAPLPELPTLPPGRFFSANRLKLLIYSPRPPRRPSPHHRAPIAIPCSTTATNCVAATSFRRRSLLAAEPPPQGTSAQCEHGAEIPSTSSSFCPTFRPLPCTGPPASAAPPPPPGQPPSPVLFERKRMTI